MKKKILAYLFVWLFGFLFALCWNNFVHAQQGEGTDQSECKWIKLNTNVPFIWNCISTKGDDVGPTEVFPTFTQALIKIVMSVILVVCFILIIVSGIQYSMDKPKEAKALIVKVARVIGLLWLSGVILKLINPTFFS